MKHIFKKQKINSQWIEENIIKPGWQKNLYPSNVNKFVNHIRNGTLIQSLITLSKRKDGILVLLDGQHKLEAIKKTDIEFVMDLCIYEDLDEKQEKQVYKALNDVKNQRLIDDIKLYLGHHDWLDAFLDNSNFPIEVTYLGGVNSIRIDRFLNVMRNGLGGGFVRRNLSRKNLPLFFEDLDADKFATMKDFCSFYKKCFGDPYKDNWMYGGNTIMLTLMKTWRMNRDKFPEEEMIKCFKPLYENINVKLNAVGVDLTTLQSLAFRVYSIINKGRSVNRFERFWDED